MSQYTAISRPDVHGIFSAAKAVPNRLIHLVPDQLAQAVPDHSLFAYPNTADPRDGFIDVSAKTFADAINATSWFLKNTLGEPKDFDTIAYIGANDIRYFLLLFGAMKVGYKMLFLSPRNNLEAHLNVLQRTDCRIFLRAADTNIDNILSQGPMRTAVVPELAELLAHSPVPTYPYAKTYDEARMDPALVLHTTGTTGLPKPVVWRAAVFSTYEAWRTIPHVGDFVPLPVIYQQARRVYTSLPLFHTSGINAAVTWALLLGVTLVFGDPRVVPNAAYVDDMHKYAGVDASMGAPSLYEELSRDAESLERIHKFQYIVASGAPLSQSAGNLISKHTRVICNLGSTETACLQRLAPPIADWDYFYWHPTHSGIDMRQYDDNLYEIFLVRDPALSQYQGVFMNFPDIDEWSMNDLYERHPDPAKSFLYRYKGRKDDVIVLSNGEKISPALMEATLRSSPLVKGAMIVGRGKFQPAALIDLAMEAPREVRHHQKLVQDLLPVIAQANEHAPAHGQLDQYHILFADPARPIQYLGQGKIQRHRTYQVYQNDIEQLYKSIDNMDVRIFDAAALHATRLDFSGKETVISGLRDIVESIIHVEALKNDKQFFEAGMDSLAVMRLSRELKIQAKLAGLPRPILEMISTKAIYRHSSLDQLASLLCPQHQQQGSLRSAPTQLANGDATQRFNGWDSNNVGGTKQNENALESTEEVPLAEDPSVATARSFLEKYTRNLPRRSSQADTWSATSSMIVLLTGSTGSLGSYLLDTLYHDKKVAHIICLDRSVDAAERHRQTGPKRGLTPLDPSRVEFLKADLSKRHLGLEDATYERLIRSVTHVIHNQWPINFNWTINSFEPYIRGVRHLIDLSLASHHNAFIQFISSVSAIGSWDSSGEGPVPEQVFDDPKMAASIGYGQSKLVAEALLDHAAEFSGVRSACCRIGIIAGPVERRLGLWNVHEYIPSIFVSSAYLGVFPATFPSRDRIDWLPVDRLSRILTEIMMWSCQNPQLDGTDVFHVVNPHTGSWQADLGDVFMAAYGKWRGIQAVSFDEWVRVLAASADEVGTSGDIDIDSNPAIRLVDFYNAASKAGDTPRSFKTTKSEKASRTLRQMDEINPDWVHNWMLQWGLRPSD